MFSLTQDDGSTYFKKSTSFADRFHDLSDRKRFTNAFEAAKYINEFEIDVLINLNGYTANNWNEIFVF